MASADKKQTHSLVIGIDLSTQSLKLVALDAESLQAQFEFLINYDTDFPDYKTKGGVHRREHEATTPTILWVAAFDRVLEMMKQKNFPFEKVLSISGSGQQHGSVYWSQKAEEELRKLDPTKPLQPQLSDAFSVSSSPIWMDSSTTKQCQELEKHLGGSQQTANITGSRAYERFTRNQIAKIVEQRREDYDKTSRISLVSSFIASLLIGSIAPIDRSDATGMNLFDIRSKKWNEDILKFTSPDLHSKLGDPVESHEIVGKISEYYVQRYSFNKDCLIVACAGDNPCSVAGMKLDTVGDIAISLGTSDTLFGVLEKPSPSADEGHIFCNPVLRDGFMALICYKNGSLTREYVRDKFAEGSWEKFNEGLSKTKPGNDGLIGFYFEEKEITPQGAFGKYRFDASDKQVEQFPKSEDEMRAVVEGQLLSMRYHANNIGIKEFRSVLATGGASSNIHIIQIISDVFGVPVYVAETANSASVGAAYRALHAYSCHQNKKWIDFSEIVSKSLPFRKAAEPNQANYELYTSLLPRYAKLERQIVELSNKQ